MHAISEHTNEATLAQARDLVMRYGWNAMAYQLLNPSMKLWFCQSDVVFGYVQAGGYRVVAGAPVGPTEQLLPAMQEFAHEARRAKLRVCYFGAQQRLTDLLKDHGPVAQLLLGAQPVWQPENWPSIIASKSSLRAQVARARNKGVAVSEWSAKHATNHPALVRCLQAWLATRGLPKMTFLVDPDTLSRLYDRRVFVAERAGSVIGFLVASPVPLRQGWLIEQIVRAPEAPNGTAEMLLDTVMRELAQQRAKYVTLGLSPLSHAAQLPQLTQTLLVRLLLTMTRIHGQRFYNFEGLDRFKAKFQPDHWEPIYAVSNERRTSLRTLYAIAGAFGGTSPVLFVSRAVARAAVQEARWASGKLRHLYTAKPSSASSR